MLKVYGFVLKLSMILLYGGVGCSSHKVHTNDIPVIYKKEFSEIIVRNQINIVLGWATWCSSCNETFSVVESLEKTYENKDISLSITSILLDDKNINKEIDVPAWMVAKLFVSGEEPEVLMSVLSEKWIASVPFIVVTSKVPENENIKIKYFYGLDEIRRVGRFVEFLRYEME